MSHTWQAADTKIYFCDLFPPVTFRQIRDIILPSARCWWCSGYFGLTSIPYFGFIVTIIKVRVFVLLFYYTMQNTEIIHEMVSCK